MGHRLRTLRAASDLVLELISERTSPVPACRTLRRRDESRKANLRLRAGYDPTSGVVWFPIGGTMRFLGRPYEGSFAVFQNPTGTRCQPCRQTVRAPAVDASKRSSARNGQ